jgi:5-methylcytosine-specific restriction endonuclease McrA
LGYTREVDASTASGGATASGYGVLVSKISLIKRLRIVATREQNGLCWWCGTQMLIKTRENAALFWDHPRVCTADHIIPDSQGGRTVRENIVAACRECNNERQ